MSAQHEALRLADLIDERPDAPLVVKAAAAQLRRLHALNAELLKALKENTEAFEIASDGGGVNFYAYAQDNRALIAKAEAQT